MTSWSPEIIFPLAARDERGTGAVIGALFSAVCWLSSLTIGGCLPPLRGLRRSRIVANSILRYIKGWLD